MNLDDSMLQSSRERIAMANDMDIPKMLLWGLVMTAIVAYALGAC